MVRELREQAAAKPAAPFSESLLDFIPRVTPRWEKPLWLAPYVNVLERAVREPIREVCAAPNQVGKSETSLHALVKACLDQPERRHAYSTYNAKRCSRMERKARFIAQRAGLKMKFRQDIWLNETTGGSLVWASRRSGLTGEPVDGLFLIDDILKDRREADSAVVLDECEDWFDDVAEPRCHTTASIVQMMSRWSKRDLSGVLIARGWPYTNIKALADGPVDDDGFVIGDLLGRRLGESINEKMKPRAAYEKKRTFNAFSFASLQQGEPRPRGGTVFNSASYYDALPTERYRVAYGVDLAYSKKKTADFSVSGEIWRHDPRPTDDNKKPKPLYYVVAVERAQVRAPEFVLVLKRQQRKRRGPMRWYASGTEAGAGQFVSEKVPQLRIKTASEDKWQRAQPVAEAWNDGRVMLPSRVALGLDPDDMEVPTPEWVSDLADEVEAFTGVGNETDDQVDMLAAGFDELERSGSAGRDDRGDGASKRQPSDLDGGGF